MGLVASSCIIQAELEVEKFYFLASEAWADSEVGISLAAAEQLFLHPPNGHRAVRLLRASAVLLTWGILAISGCCCGNREAELQLLKGHR